MPRSRRSGGWTACTLTSPKNGTTRTGSSAGRRTLGPHHHGRKRKRFCRGWRVVQYLIVGAHAVSECGGRADTPQQAWHVRSRRGRRTGHVDRRVLEEIWGTLPSPLQV